MFLCDFHREQSWDRWLKKKANGCADEKLKILSLLRSIARSDTEEKCEKAIEILKNSVYWAEEPFREYISKYWLSIKQVIL